MAGMGAAWEYDATRLRPLPAPPTRTQVCAGRLLHLRAPDAALVSAPCAVPPRDFALLAASGRALDARQHHAPVLCPCCALHQVAVALLH